MTKIYSLGSNGSGQLGIGHKEDVSVPKPALLEPHLRGHVEQLKAGGNHTLLLSSGKLYMSGDRTTGACGLTLSSENVAAQFHEFKLSFQCQDSLPTLQVCLCNATWEASFIATEDENGRASRVYSFGTGNKGELGQGQFIFRTAKPELIAGFPPTGVEVVDLAASVTHVVAVLSNGEVYGWGSGRKGQLGQPEEIIYSPRKISGVDFHAVRAVCGREFTYIVGKDSGQHVILGSDKWNVKSSAPSAVPGWKDIAASWGSIFVLQEDGKLLSWGRNDHGQLAPPGLPKLLQVAIGSEHALGLTHNQSVIAWGWGEHGNCGPNTQDGDVKGRWNVIASAQYLPPDSRIWSIGAGCATSWVCVTS